MLSAVHTDRSGRVYVSAECTVAGSDGVGTIPIERWLPLPTGATLVPLPREALGLDRHGRARGLGRDRWALGAALPPGHLRTLYPAYRPTAEPLTVAPCAAVGADPTGALGVAAMIVDPAGSVPPPEPVGLAARIADTLRESPGNRLIRQLARCARENGCADARAMFLQVGAGALPVGGAGTFDLALRRGIERAAPTESAAFTPSAEEIATVAIGHLERGGPMVSFGRACDGEPLAALRVILDAISRIRGATRRGIIHLETDGTHPQALRRAVEAGLDQVTVRLEEGRDAVRRESLHLAAAAGAALAVAVLVRPGCTDTPEELDRLEALLASLPGGLLLFRDSLGFPPHRARPEGAPLGVAAALARLAKDAPHFRMAAFARPLVTV